MLRYLPVLTLAALAHAWCAAPVHATCGDYLHTISQQDRGAGVELSTDDADPFTEPGRGGSCDSAPDHPPLSPVPVSVPTVIDVAVLSAGSPLLALDGQPGWRSSDEIAADDLVQRIDRPPRAGWH